MSDDSQHSLHTSRQSERVRESHRDQPSEHVGMNALSFSVPVLPASAVVMFLALLSRIMCVPAVLIDIVCGM